jgi:trk system potassium uptake protein TrkA
MAKIQAGVIGLGKFGLKFAETLVEMGHDVIGVDKNDRNIKQAQQILPHVYKADATNKQALIQIGIDDCTHALVSAGQSISASVMISMYLKELKVPMVWVKAIHSDHKKVLEMIKVDKVIIPEHSAAREFANRMAVPGFIEYLPFGKDIVIKKLVVKKWAGRTLRELDLTNQHGIQVVALKNTGTDDYVFIPRADLRLKEGDKLVTIGRTGSLDKINT